jgi:hypothetical protein
MPAHRQRRAVGSLAALAVGLTLVVAPLATAPRAVAAPADAWPLVVTEIAPDTTGYDDFEYVEVHNPTAAPVPLGAGGYGLAYTYADSEDRTRDVALSVPDGTVVPAGGTVVLWLQYAAGNVDTSRFTVNDFRAFWAARGAGDGYPVVPLTGQAGMANGGNRGIRVLDPAGSTVGWSFVPTGGVGPDQVVQLRTPVDAATRAMDVLATLAPPTPGTVAPEQLEDRAPTPTPTPTATPDPTPDPTPTASPTAGPTATPTTTPTAAPGEAAAPPADSLVGHLQLTELMVDSTNVGGSDGYEYVEVTNVTDAPVSFADYTIRYLYPDESYVTTSSALWHGDPADAVVPAGGAIVLWVKNAGNQGLTRADFNRFWGTSVPAGQILEVASGGMANGSPRGVEVVTRTGVTVSRGYYNMGGARDVVVDRGLAYRADPADLSRQVLLGARAATPGTVEPDQLPTTLVTATPDAQGPRVSDASPDVVDPTTDLVLAADVADDRQVRRVELHVRTDRDDVARVVDLTPDAAGRYASTLKAVDLVGKRAVTYWFVASDGTHVVTTDPVTLPVAGASTDPVRLGVADGDLLRGTTTLAVAADDPDADLALAVDGAALTPTYRRLERSAVFAAEVTATDDYFQNGVILPSPTGDACHDGTVLTIFDEGTYGDTITVTATVPVSATRPGEDLTLLVSAGTKAWPCQDADENNDDFTLLNPRLVLPDGRTLTPAGYAGGPVAMGDSAGKTDDYPAVFTLPSDAFAAVGHDWDSTAVADGTHVVTGTDGTDVASARVVVDNTAPDVEVLLDADTTGPAGLQGAITLDARATDATSSVAAVTATLDGDAVTLPHTTSSLRLAPREHELAVTATDAAGNVTTRTERFVTPREEPTVELVTPADGARVEGAAVPLTARVADPTGDAMQVRFLAASHATTADVGVTAAQGVTHDAAAADRGDATVLTADQRVALAAVDNRDTTVSSDDAFPYQVFDVAVPAGTGDDARVVATWDGAAEPGATVALHVWDTAAGAWQRVDRHVGDPAADAPFTLRADVAAAHHVVDGTVRFLVQHSEGWAGPVLSDRSTPVTPAHPDDTPRDAYDFTLAWESDTQYYNEQFYDHQLAIHRYLLERREALNLQYLFHTGDIVDNHDQQYQWENADAAYRMLDEAGLPYGVLAGNHDVGNFDLDWTSYGRYFGERRFAGNPWYGGSHQDNRGHYDLFSAGGVDFVVVSMGWGPGDAEIAWMNDVLAQHPNRVAIVNLHEYLLTTGGLGPIPQRIQDEVVATNPNVRMVMSGHYHDAYTRIDRFDDDQDGTAERVVTQMLFDYQGLPEGGQGFLRLLHFDNAGQRILVRTYSPSLGRYDSEDPTLDPEHQEFTITYADAGITPRTKELRGDAFVAEVRTGVELATASQVAAVSVPAVAGAARVADLGAGGPGAGALPIDGGATAVAPFASAAPTALDGGRLVEVAWTPADGTHGWYVEVTDAHGAVVESEVRRVTFTATGAGAGPGGGTAPGGVGSGGVGSGGAEGGAGRGAQPGAARGGLATTGADALALALLAGGLLAAGAGALLARRRRA